MLTGGALIGNIDDAERITCTGGGASTGNSEGESNKGSLEHHIGGNEKGVNDKNLLEKQSDDLVVVVLD